MNFFDAFGSASALKKDASDEKNRDEQDPPPHLTQTSTTKTI
jgi:hypothetical protein